VPSPQTRGSQCDAAPFLYPPSAHKHGARCISGSLCLVCFAFKCKPPSMKFNVLGRGLQFLGCSSSLRVLVTESHPLRLKAWICKRCVQVLTTKPALQSLLLPHAVLVSSWPSVGMAGHASDASSSKSQQQGPHIVLDACHKVGREVASGDAECDESLSGCAADQWFRRLLQGASTRFTCPNCLVEQRPAKLPFAAFLLPHTSSCKKSGAPTFQNRSP